MLCFFFNLFSTFFNNSGHLVLLRKSLIINQLLRSQPLKYTLFHQYLFTLNTLLFYLNRFLLFFLHQQLKLGIFDFVFDAALRWGFEAFLGWCGQHLEKAILCAVGAAVLFVDILKCRIGLYRLLLLAKSLVFVI